jgi:hypothetical protein
MPNVIKATVEYRRMLSDGNYGNITAGVVFEVDLVLDAHGQPERPALAVEDALDLARAYVLDALEESGAAGTARQSRSGSSAAS